MAQVLFTGGTSEPRFCHHVCRDFVASQISFSMRKVGGIILQALLVRRMTLGMAGSAAAVTRGGMAVAHGLTEGACITVSVENGYFH